MIKEKFISELTKKPSNDPRFDKSNGKIYSDGVYARAGQRVTGISVTIGDDFINSIQFIYDSDPDLSQRYGSSDGRRIDSHFDKDEYITKFSWISGYNNYYANTDGAFTWNIIVTTNKDKYVFGVEPTPYYCGDKKRYEITADDGHRIVGIRCKARCSDADAQPSDKVGTYGKAVNTLFAISHVYQVEIENTISNKDTWYSDYSYVVNANKLTNIKGATCDGCINRIQFVYDYDESLTVSHGKSLPGEKEFSIKLREEVPLTRIEYETANCDDTKYGDSAVLTYFKVNNGQDCTEVVPDDSDNRRFYHKHTYRMLASENEEIWALTGTYHEYMGNFTSYFVRPINQGRVALSSSTNKTGNDVLVINVESRENAGESVDEAVEVLAMNWRAWYNNNKNKLPQFDFIPAKSGAHQVLCKMEPDMVKNTILNGGYKYITFHCHGTYVFAGNQYALIDNIWALNNKGKFNNMVFHFNCCECGYRLIDNYTHKSGLAASLVEAGASAAFGYTVAHDVPNFVDYAAMVQGTGDKYEKNARLVKTICHNLIAGVDTPYLLEKKKPTAAAQAFIDEFNSMMNQLKTTFDLDDTILTEVKSDYEKEKNKAGFIETTEIYTQNSSSGRTARLQRIEDKLKTMSIQKSARFIYMLYFRLFFSVEHFVGPRNKVQNNDKKKKNLGDLCTQYGGIDSSEL